MLQNSIAFGQHVMERSLKCGLLDQDGSGKFVALDGTAMTVKAKDDPSLPAPLPTATMLRQTVWGVEDEAALTEIEAELSKDRDVTHDGNGRLICKDDMGFELAFQVTARKKLDLPAELVNSPGAPAARPANVIGANEEADALPRTLSLHRPLGLCHHGQIHQHRPVPAPTMQ